jgi:tetratricopeptide (TPR) repeat protein
MGKELIAKLLPAVEKMQWPQGNTATEQGRQTFTVAVEKVDEYKGDPKTLMAALRTLQTGDSLPYAYGGVACVLVAAAREKDGSYDPAGLEAAMGWLEEAQNAEPDILEINVIEALIYAYSGRLEDSRLILDYLQAQDPTNFRLLSAEIAYWRSQGDIEKTVEWYEQAAEGAATVPQRLRLQAELGDYYLESNLLDKALAVHQKAIHFNNKNYMAWHKMSLIYWRQEDYEEADRCNQQALRLQDFPAARKMEAALKKKKSEGGMLGRLFGNR